MWLYLEFLNIFSKKKLQGTENMRKIPDSHLDKKHFPKKKQWKPCQIRILGAWLYIKSFSFSTCNYAACKIYFILVMVNKSMAASHFRSEHQTLSTVAPILIFSISAHIIATEHLQQKCHSEASYLPLHFVSKMRKPKWVKLEFLSTSSFQFPFSVKKAVEGFERSWRAHSCCLPIPEPKYPQRHNHPLFSHLPSLFVWKEGRFGSSSDFVMAMVFSAPESFIEERYH